MSPILAVGYIFNLFLINATYSLVGLVLTLGLSALIYFLLSKNAGDNRKFIAQIIALAAGYVSGTVAIVNAPWSTPAFTLAAVMIEVLVFFIFLFIGRR